MCGICGFVSKQNISLDQLKTMNQTMLHRGPDDGGEEIYMMHQGYMVGLAQRRLSIMDLSPLGHQPMHSADGRVSVVFNGEIYNHLALKKQLSGYPFRSTCDTEVIIAAYLKWGIECIHRLNGMFAIALYDRDMEALYLVRDRIGKKPLYYQLENGDLYFASELKPLMERPGFAGNIRQDVLARYLQQQYINAPETVFETVYKLEPGSILTFRYGVVEQRKYWDIKTVYHEMQAQPVKTYEEAKAGLKDRLKKSVADRMIADVPLGSFLSGGYDSSLVTALAQEHSSAPVKTFSIGFHEERYNEAGYAREVANYLGTEHTELYIDEEEMYKQVADLPKYFDEPFADSSQIPTMLVSRLAREKVTVALSGDGGDEFFCGYNLYKNVKQAQQLDWLGGIVYGMCQTVPGKKMELLQRLPFKVQVIAANRDANCKTQLTSEKYLSAIKQMVPENDGNLSNRYCTEQSYQVSDWQIRRMLLDMDTYLPGDILCKVDRASMKYSLESRCPILDTEVMEYSFRIPHQFKYHKGDKKHILKEIAYDYIPKDLLDRPKVGFSVPLDKWLRGGLRDRLLDYSNVSYLEKQGLFCAQYVHDMVRAYLKTGDAGPSTGANYSRLCWAFLEFQEWYQMYKERFAR